LANYLSVKIVYRVQMSTHGNFLASSLVLHNLTTTLEVIFNHLFFFSMNFSVRFSRKDQAEFVKTLRARVNDYFNSNEISRTATPLMVIKTISMYVIYFTPYVLMLTGVITGWWTLLMWAIMSVGMAGIGFAIMHDANHGSYSRNPIINTLLGSSMELLGGNSYTWKVTHNMMHHTYTNIYELDDDVKDRPILRLSPYGKWSKIHKYQHIYAIFLYSLSTLSWFFQKDWKEVFQFNRTGFTEKQGRNPQMEVVKLIAGKVFYITYALILPLIFISAPWYVVLIGFLFMHLVASILTTIVFQLAHVVEGPSHHEPDESFDETNWLVHQLETTADFARNNALVTWFLGGLNFQIEHHLFPNICHVHYRKISDIVQQTAREYGLPYHEFKTMRGAVVSHLRTLKKFGQREHIPAMA
jgi:linoleoyl-CoA desaturase